MGDDNVAGAPESTAVGPSPPPEIGCSVDVGRGLLDGAATTRAVGATVDEGRLVISPEAGASVIVTDGVMMLGDITGEAADALGLSVTVGTTGELLTVGLAVGIRSVALGKFANLVGPCVPTAVGWGCRPVGDMVIESLVGTLPVTGEGDIDGRGRNEGMMVGGIDCDLDAQPPLLLLGLPGNLELFDPFIPLMPFFDWHKSVVETQRM